MYDSILPDRPFSEKIILLEALRINPTSGIGTIIGSLAPQGDFSALAFDSSGTLFTINSTGFSNSILNTVNPSTGLITSTLTLNVDLGSTVGMAFDPLSGVAFVADGGDFATNALYTLNVTTGFLNSVGPIGDLGGIAGLTFVTVPEPTSMALTGFGIGIFMFRKLKKRTNEKTSPGFC